MAKRLLLLAALLASMSDEAAAFSVQLSRPAASPTASLRRPVGPRRPAGAPWRSVVTVVSAQKPRDGGDAELSPRARAAAKIEARRLDDERDLAANAQSRLESEYARWQQSPGFTGETLSDFEARRSQVQSKAKRNGWVALGLAVVVNVKLVLSPPEIKAVAKDANGICVPARADRLRDLPGTNSAGQPCMPLGAFLRGVLF
ncbi:hypothetical protein M885DRAFT_522204 [Pelagophyceae sp. CCMP2097]|nr:hypothetical protein M885DRAFT_522204 [Pelagophyceae sp. CCMP2097]